MIPSRSTAALPPQPLPFFCSRAGGGGFVPGLGFAGAGLATAGFAAAAFAGADARGGGAAGAGRPAGTAGPGLVGGRFAGGAGGGDITICSITRVPPPFATPTPSSVGSNTSETSPNRTVAPGVSGASPLIRSPSMKVPFVESRSTNTHTPSRRCSFAWVVETDSSGRTRSL